MTDLLKEAIAEAKAVREVAMENAKIALEEAFTPRLQSMIASKLSEESEEDDDFEQVDEDDNLAADEEEIDIPVEEGDEDAEDFSAKEEPEEDTEEEDTEEEDTEEEDTEEEDTEEEDVPVEEGDEEDDQFEMDEDLMEIIRQLEEEADSSEIGTGDNKKPSASSSSTTTKYPGKGDLFEEDEVEDAPVEDESEEDVDIQEILRKLREEDEGESEEVETEEPVEEPAEEPVAERLEEAYSVIKYLRSKLNEVNLLNSKLLFTSKLFRSYSLTNEQKTTVLENFDRASSLREVKLVYSTLAESLRSQSLKKPSTSSTKKVKTSLKESFIPSASKSIQPTRPSKKIIEDPQVNRFRELITYKQ